MKVFLFLAVTLVSAHALASEYTCQTSGDEVSAYLVFDDGPGGLDHASIKVHGQEYGDFAEIEPSIFKITDRDTYKKTYEYGDDKIEIGFTAENGLKLDIFVHQVEEKLLSGSVILKAAGTKKSTLLLTCTEH